MSPILWRYLLRLFVTFFAAILAGVTVLYLLVDYGDRQRLLHDLSTAQVLHLYALRSVMALQQLAPAAMLLAAGSTLSTLRQRGEWVALQSLGVSRLQVLTPILAAGLGLGVVLVVIDDQLVTRAALAARDLSPQGFQSFAARPAVSRDRWFRVGNAFLQVRGAQTDDAFHEVALYEMTDDFRLARVIHASSLEALPQGQWLAREAAVHIFSADGGSAFSQVPELALPLGALTREALLVSGALPEELRLSELRAQVDLRGRAGLPIHAWAYMMNLRVAYPLMGVAAALLAALLALRLSRRGHLTMVLLEGVAIAFLLIVLLTVSRTLVMSGRLSAIGAAWLPVVGLLITLVVVLWSQRPRAVRVA